MGVPIWRPKSPSFFNKKRPKVGRGSEHELIHGPGLNLNDIPRHSSNIQRRQTIRRVGLRRRQTLENLHLYMANSRRRLNEDHGLEPELAGSFERELELENNPAATTSRPILYAHDPDTESNNIGDSLRNTLERYPSIRYYGPNWDDPTSVSTSSSLLNHAEERDDHGNSDHYDHLEELIALADRSSAWRPAATSLRLPSIDSRTSSSSGLINETTPLQIRRPDVMEPGYSSPSRVTNTNTGGSTGGGRARNGWIPTSVSTASSTGSATNNDLPRPQVHFTNPVAVTTNSVRTNYPQEDAVPDSASLYYVYHSHRVPYEREREREHERTREHEHEHEHETADRDRS